MAKIRILLIEDNRLLREGIARMLENHGSFEIQARSEDGDAVRRLKEQEAAPDIVLLDLGLEKADSLKLMARLRREAPEAKVIAMDILPEQVDVVEFVKAGGAGFILKSAAVEEYIGTIEAVARGEKVLPPVLTTSLFTQIVESAIESGDDAADQSIRLTPREKEVVDLVADGMSNKEIASRLHIATHTVKSHIHNILEKLALSTRLQIATFARKKKRSE
jgi:two-component system nitrate/nitrite response regulator NarL